MTDEALILSPSRGLGGGIERYVETLEWAFAEKGVRYRRLDLCRAGLTAHTRILRDARRQLRSSLSPARLIVAHRCLLPVARVLLKEDAVRGISVVCHGAEAWTSRLRPRSVLEQRLMRGTDLRVIAVSNYTSGALSRSSRATLLPPGLSRKWFDTLVAASAYVEPARAGVNLVTAFRLADWRDKGLVQLLDAIGSLGRDDIRLTVCGSGRPPDELRRLVAAHQCCTLRSGLTDTGLARELAAADLFILATRTRVGRRSSGEGFGLVLLESQVAGTPVMGPALGGSHEAFVERVTGVSPVDETSGAMAVALEQLLGDPWQLEQMGKRQASGRVKHSRRRSMPRGS